jgi:lipoate-protein ligase B
MSHTCLRDAYFVDLSLMEYRKAWDLQTRLLEARVDGLLDKDLILCLEHPPVFTLGRRGGLENLKVAQTFLDSQGIEVIHVERGGDITYHGPGQLVLYPIVDLKSSGCKVVDFVQDLEEIMIRILSEWGLQGERNNLNRGVWIGRTKIGSIGIAVRRGVSFHGLALNVNTGLAPFGWVNPCGLTRVMVTSMKKILGKEIPMDEVRRQARISVEQVLGVQLIPIGLDETLNIINLSGSRPRSSVNNV